MSIAENIETGTNVVRVVRDLEASNKLSLVDLLAALSVDAPDLDAQGQIVQSGPKAVTATDDQRVALRRLSDMLDGYEWPKSRRELTAAEKAAVTELVQTVKDAKSLVEKAEAQLREVVLNHGDVLAERTGAASVDTPRDKKGHYLIGDEHGLSVKDRAVKVWRKLTSPRTVILPGDVADQVTAGNLSKAEAKRVIRMVPVFDEDGMLALIAQKPNLAEVFASIARKTGGSVAMTLGSNQQ